MSFDVVRVSIILYIYIYIYIYNMVNAVPEKTCFFFGNLCKTHFGNMFDD